MFVAEDIHFEAIVNADLLDKGGHQPFLELEKKKKNKCQIKIHIIGKKFVKLNSDQFHEKLYNEKKSKK